MQRALPIETVIERINNRHNNTIKIENYKSVREKADFECLVCGHKWKSHVNMIFKSGCKKCFENKERHSYNFVKEYIEKEGCLLLSKEYKNNRTKINVLFSCGHEGNLCFYSFKNGNRCRICGKNKVGQSNREPKKIKKILKIKKFKFICFPDGYKDRNNKIDFYCNCGHYNSYKIRDFFKNKNCRICTKEKSIKNKSGFRSSSWKGGTVKIRNYIHTRIIEWKKKSMENCGYKCVITGERFDDIHHLYPLNLIIEEALNKLKYNKYRETGKYTEKQLNKILKEVINIHDKYPLGICLKKSVHKTFHKLYGNNCLPEDFYDFQIKIKKGLISL